MRWEWVWEPTIMWDDHDDVKWKHVRVTGPLCGDSPHKDQWRETLMFSLIYAWTNGLANVRDTGDLRRHRAHYDVIVLITMWLNIIPVINWNTFMGLNTV